MAAVARKYWATLAGSLTIVAILFVSAVLIGGTTIDSLVRTEARTNARTFAEFLQANDAHLNSLMTGIARVRDLEARTRRAATLAGIDRFAIFDASGRQAYASRSDQHEWHLRDRPGGLKGRGQLAIPENPDPSLDWQVVDHATGEVPRVLMPLQRNGTLIGYLAADVVANEKRANFQESLKQAMTLLVLVLIVVTGLPVLVYIRRKRRVDEADEHIFFLHNHDALTSLLNRRRMQEETERILATTRATRERLALWYLDVDRLSEINDGFGQACGDEVLRRLADRLTEVVDRGDLVSRIGSDDFAVLQRHYSGEESARDLAQRMLAALTEPIELGDQTIRPSVSLGVALVPDHGRTYAELVKHAEHAFIHQKNVRRKPYTVFEPAMDQETHRRRQIDKCLRNALENNSFRLFYQPIVSGAGRRLVGFEALLRLPDGEGGYIPPSEFVPIAEMRGYVKAIGTWVINEAARQAAEWPEELFVSVNLSAVQFRDGDLVSIVAAALKEAGIEGRRLGIEVVESLLLDHSAEVLEQLRALKRFGISIDMDDFGTGYSSLGYLWRFPFDKLKIDQSFMSALSEGRSNVSQIIETIISLAHHLGLKVTGEGIETREQADLLQAFGCNQLQGFYFGRPMPPEEVAVELLSRFSTEELPHGEPVARLRARA